MRLDLRKQILTLVVTSLYACFFSITAIAAPEEPPPKKPHLQETPSAPSPHKSYELESVELREQPAQSTLNRPEFLPTRVVRQHSRVFSAGIWSGTLKNRDAETASGLNLDVQNDNINETGQSYGVSVLSNGVLGLHGDYHINCCLGAHYEPFWGLGVGSLWDPSESLVSFVNIDRYQIRFRGGFEDMFNLKRRLRLETVVQWGTLGFSGFLTLGWTWDQHEFWF